MGHTDTLVTLRGRFSPDVSFKVNFWGKVDPQGQLEVVLKAWTEITGLNWSAMPTKEMEAHEDWRGFTVTSPLTNRPDGEFVWQV